MNVTPQYGLTEGKCTSTDSIQIESTLIDGFIAGLPSPDHTLQLTIAINCDTEIAIVLDENNLTQGSPNFYSLVPVDLSMTGSITDNVYDLTITKTVTASGSTENDFGCIFVNCTTICDLADFIGDNLEYVISGKPALHFIYDVISNVEACDQCKCDKICKAFLKLKEIMGQEIDANDCGC